MTQNGGFTFLIAWAIFAVLCGVLAYFVLRGPVEESDHRHGGTDRRPNKDRQADAGGRVAQPEA
jgi:hypothetical protein